VKRISKLLLAITLLIFATTGAHAGLKKLGNAGFSFLKVTQSARTAAMGDAYTAVATDINSIYWNPAGLVHITRPTFTFGYNNWMVESKFYSGALAVKLGTQAIGISVVSFTPDPFEETTIFQPNGTGNIIQDSDIAIGLSYAIQFTDRLSFGAQARFIQEKLYTDTNRGIDVSVGTLFYTGFRSLRLAMSLKNFGQDIVIIDDTAFRPLVYNIGVAMEVYGNLGDPVSLTVAADNAFFVDYEGRLHTGAELWLHSLFALRAGWKFNNDTESYTLGFGLKHHVAERPFTLDFSYSDMGDLLDATYRISVGGAF
jgi:hypothetical protein